MAAPDTKIRAAFLTRLLTFPDCPPRASVGVAFTPGTVPYLAPFLLPGEPFQSECGTNGANRHVGIFQVSVFAPSGQGDATINTLRDSLIDYFKRGTTMVNSDISVRVEKAYASAVITEVGWLHIPITIRYRTDVSN